MPYGLSTDYPAHSEMCCTKNQGQSACWRCRMRGVPVTISSRRQDRVTPGITKYYYPSAKEFWADRGILEWTMSDLVQCTELVEEAAYQTASSYMELSCELGVTGRSILLRFNNCVAGTWSWTPCLI